MVTRNRAIDKAISRIPDDAWIPVKYPGAVTDPDSGGLISDAQVAEVPHTAFTSTNHPVTARLVVHRVRDQAKLDELFPVWRYHPFLTDSTEPTALADVTHRKHAIIETVHSDLIDGPLAVMPSGRFSANSAWLTCAAITHNLLRVAGSITGDHAVTRGATLRRQLIADPRPHRETTRQTRHPPDRPLALGRCVATAVEQGDAHHRRSAPGGLTLDHRRHGQPGHSHEKMGRPAAQACV